MWCIPSHHTSPHSRSVMVWISSSATTVRMWWYLFLGRTDSRFHAHALENLHLAADRRSPAEVSRDRNLRKSGLHATIRKQLRDDVALSCNIPRHPAKRKSKTTRYAGARVTTFEESSCGRTQVRL